MYSLVNAISSNVPYSFLGEVIIRFNFEGRPGDLTTSKSKEEAAKYGDLCRAECADITDETEIGKRDHKVSSFLQVKTEISTQKFCSSLLDLVLI